MTLVVLLSLSLGNTAICSESEEEIKEREEKVASAGVMRAFLWSHDGKDKDLNGVDFREVLIKWLPKNLLIKSLGDWLYYRVDFSRANLEGANLSGLDLTDIKFDSAKFDEKTDFRKCIFFQERGIEASLKEAKNLNKAKLEGASFGIGQVNAHLKKLSERNDQVSFEDQLSLIENEFGITIVDKNMFEEFG